MNTILVQNKWEENKLITKKDIINSNFECEIFINENKLLDSMTVKKIIIFVLISTKIIQI